MDGNSGRYLAVRNSASAQALSSLTRGREYDGFTRGRQADEQTGERDGKDVLGTP